MKYDYTGAAVLYDEFYELLGKGNPDEITAENQQCRRQFIHDLTRKNVDDEIEYIWARICFSAIDYKTNKKTRRYIAKLDKLMQKIIDFEGVK